MDTMTFKKNAGSWTWTLMMTADGAIVYRDFQNNPDARTYLETADCLRRVACNPADRERVWNRIWTLYLDGAGRAVVLDALRENADDQGWE